MNSEQFPINAFDSLLRDMLYWGLVTKVDKPPGHCWELNEQAGLRLDEFVADSISTALPVERIVFFDYRCNVCGVRQMTRVHESRFVCDACWAKDGHSLTTDTTPVSPGEVA